MLIPRTFWTVSSLGSELSAQLEFQTFFRKLLSTLPAFLFRGLDAILGKLIVSAGLTPLLQILLDSERVWIRAWCTAGVSDFLRETTEYAASPPPGQDDLQYLFRLLRSIANLAIYSLCPE